MKTESIYVNFTKRYALALVLIAFLATGVFSTFHFALKIAESTALIVNISGKQRMLSQRIALLAHNYALDMEKENSNDAFRTKELLMDAIDEMKDANIRLSSGVLNETMTVELSSKIYEYYFGKTDVKRRVNEYLDLVNSFLKVQNDTESTKILIELTQMSATLLPDLNQIVLQYQNEGEEGISKIKNIELVAWIATLFTLLIEVIFIFQPMSNRIQELFQKEVWSKNHLEQEIKIRTQSLEQANEKLKYIASHDPLTGLNNRLYLERDLENLLIHYNQNHIDFAVLMIDIDWFKSVNDNYGHDVGDFVLKEMAILISGAIRSEDGAYRAGGEEFVIILNRISESEAMEKAEKIRKIIEAHTFIVDKHSLKITISGGLYHSKLAEAIDIHGIIKFADHALYNAKNTGRNRIFSVQTA